MISWGAVRTIAVTLASRTERVPRGVAEVNGHALRAVVDQLEPCDGSGTTRRPGPLFAVVMSSSTHARLISGIFPPEYRNCSC